ncbi:MAG: tetratricopeptide repeat protein [Bacteroidales bacterium]
MRTFKQLLLPILTILLALQSLVVLGQTDTLKATLKNLSPEERVEVYDRLAKTFENDSIELSLKYQKLSYEASVDLGEAKLMIKQAEKLADKYTHLARYNSAIEFYDKAINLAKRNDFSDNIGRLFRYLGNAYYYKGEFDKSLEAHLLSQEYAKEHNDEHGIASAYNNIGLIYMKMADYDLALENYLKSEMFFSKLENNLNHGMALINIGNIYYFKNDLPNALDYYKQALNISEEANLPSQIALASQNLSIVYQDLKNIEEALRYGVKAYNLYRENNDVYGLTNITRNVGYLYFDVDSLAKAEKLFLESIRYARQTNSLQSISDSYKALSDFYSNKGDYKRAYEYLAAQNLVVDSLYEMETDRKLAELEATHELDRQKKEHKLLQKFFILMSILALLIVFVLLFNYRVKVNANRDLKEKNVKIEEQNMELEEINATKNKFFSIIAHDLKNPLAAFIGFMDTLQEKIQDMTAQEQKENLKQVTMLAENMLDFLENLLKWGRSQVGVLEFKPENVNLNALVEQAIRIVSWNAITKNISIHNRVDDSLMVMCDKNMLLTVMRNLISNAVKFSYQGDEISITSDNKEDGVSLLVKDNGIGIPEEELDQLFKIDTRVKRPGTAKEMGTGLGLILCKEFVEYHGGNMIFHSQEGKGSVFGFTIKRSTRID